jgi:hypothetical protein
VVTFTCKGKDAEIVEAAARQLCFEGQGNCYQPKCKNRQKCRVEGWASYTGDVESVLRVIRETSAIVPNTKSRK